MDAKHLCLGALCLGDASGYDIKKLFELAFSHFQAAGFGSIYPALARLTEEGLVTRHTDQQEGRPERRVFQVTDAGREAFRRRLAEAQPEERLRSDFLLLMFFAHELSAARLGAVLHDYRDRLEQTLGFLDGLLLEHELTPGMRFSIEISIAATRARRDFVAERGDALVRTVTAPENQP